MEFEKAIVTKSRLMGSIGLYIRWKEEDSIKDQFFLLDAEEDGIADYVGLENADDSSVNIELNRLMGGLGASTEALTENEAKTLLFNYGKINLRGSLTFPEPFKEYEKLLKKDTSLNMRELFMKTCTAIDTDIEFINYMTMRLVAKDDEAIAYFCSESDNEFPRISEKPGSLLKNNVVRVSKDRYFSNAVLEDDTGYYRIKIGFTVIGEESFSIRSILITDKQRIPDSIIKSEIARPEYIANFRVLDEDVDKQLLELMPMLFKVDFDNGIMFTRFKVDNAHVKQDVYRISDDLEGIYFLNKKELVFAAFDEKSYQEGILVLKESENIKLINEFIFPYPVIYDFAQSEYENFSKFLTTV